MKRRGWVPSLGIALFAGLIYGLSPVPRDFYILGLCGGPLLCVALERAPTIRTGFFAGWITCTAINAIVLAWILPLLIVYGGIPLIGSVPIALLLWVGSAVDFALAGAVVVALRPVAPPWLTLPVALPVATALMPALFPWHVSTSQLGFLPWLQCVELSGPVTADLPMLLAGTALLHGWRTRSWRVLAVGACAFLLPTGYGLVRLAQVRAERETWRHLSVGVVQPSADIPEKFDSATFPDQVHRLHALTVGLEARGAELVVWPETSFPVPLDHGRRVDITGRFYSLRAEGVHGPLLLGVETYGPGVLPGEHERHYNSAISVARDGHFVGIADKVQLLAFGEYVPFWDQLVFLHTSFPSRGLTPGTGPVLLEAGGARVLVLNCYEDVLGPYTARAARLAPSLLVNITNDAWFGDTDEPWLHDGIARFRTIETRTDLVRSVNTGTSTHIAATGEELQHTHVFVPTSFLADVRLRPAGATQTPFVMFGDWLTPALCALLLGWAWQARPKRQGDEAHSTPA